MDDTAIAEAGRDFIRDIVQADVEIGRASCRERVYVLV